MLKWKGLGADEEFNFYIKSYFKSFDESFFFYSSESDDRSKSRSAFFDVSFCSLISSVLASGYSSS